MPLGEPPQAEQQRLHRFDQAARAAPFRREALGQVSPAPAPARCPRRAPSHRSPRPPHPSRRPISGFGIAVRAPSVRTPQRAGSSRLTAGVPAPAAASGSGARNAALRHRPGQNASDSSSAALVISCLTKGWQGGGRKPARSCSGSTEAFEQLPTFDPPHAASSRAPTPIPTVTPSPPVAKLRYLPSLPPGRALPALSLPNKSTVQRPWRLWPRPCGDKREGRRPQQGAAPRPPGPDRASATAGRGRGRRAASPSTPPCRPPHRRPRPIPASQTPCGPRMEFNSARSAGANSSPRRSRSDERDGAGQRHRQLWANPGSVRRNDCSAKSLAWITAKLIRPIPIFEPRAAPGQKSPRHSSRPASGGERLPKAAPAASSTASVRMASVRVCVQADKRQKISQRSSLRATAGTSGSVVCWPAPTRPHSSAARCRRNQAEAGIRFHPIRAAPRRSSATNRRNCRPAPACSAAWIASSTFRHLTQSRCRNCSDPSACGSKASAASTTAARRRNSRAEASVCVSTNWPPLLGAAETSSVSSPPGRPLLPSASDRPPSTPVGRAPGAAPRGAGEIVRPKAAEGSGEWKGNRTSVRMGLGVHECGGKSVTEAVGGSTRPRRPAIPGAVRG